MCWAVRDVAGCAVCASAAPSSWRIGGCAGCCGGRLTVFAVQMLLSTGRPPPPPPTSAHVASLNDHLRGPPLGSCGGAPIGWAGVWKGAGARAAPPPTPQHDPKRPLGRGGGGASPVPTGSRDGLRPRLGYPTAYGWRRPRAPGCVGRLPLQTTPTGMRAEAKHGDASV